MAMHAYPEMYLPSTQNLLGEAFDYAVHNCQVDAESFWQLFAASSYSQRLENGEPASLLGRTGAELAKNVLEETAQKYVRLAAQDKAAQSVEYCVGWALAYYQWYTGRKFSELAQACPFTAWQKMYFAGGKPDLGRFVTAAEVKMKEYFEGTNLKHMRSAYGCTQAELAQWSGISLHDIRMYEQYKRGINNASAETVFRLAQVLGCSMEDLVEKC